MNMRGTYTLSRRETLRFKSGWLQTIVGPVIGVLLFVVVFTAALLIAVGLLASIAFAILGLINGILATRVEYVAGMSIIIIAPLTMLAGTFYSVSSLTEPSRSLSYLNPVFVVVDAFRAPSRAFRQALRHSVCLGWSSRTSCCPGRQF